MNLLRYSIGAIVCGAIMACGGNSPKPVVEPTAPVEKKDTISLENPVDRYSYALGMYFGKEVASVNIPLNMDLVISGLKDEVNPSKLALLADTAWEAAFQDMFLKMQQKKVEDEKAAVAKNLDDQVKFLARNILDSTVKTTPKGVQYRVLKEGTGESPKATDKVLVHYIGALLDGTQFDNSVQRGEPLEFQVQAVIEGWQDLLETMTEGEKVKAWIPSELAYGEAGVPPVIPGNSLLIFEVELLKVYKPEPVVDSTAADSAAVLDSAAVGAPVPADSAKAPVADSAAVNSTVPAAVPADAKPEAEAPVAAPAEAKPAAEAPAEAPAAKPAEEKKPAAKKSKKK